MIQPPAVLLAGPSGSGKTSALVTQLLAGLEVFVIMTEPDGVSSLLDAADRLKAPIDKLHWASALPHGAGWMDLEDMISKVNSMDQKGLADIRDLGKSSFRPAAINFLNQFKNFKCERTGQEYGDFTTWDDSRSLSIDSLTGWSLIAWGVTVGYKPTANPGEWGIAQNVIANQLQKINNDRKCFFNLTAHIEKEMDDLTGVRRVMISTIGAKLAPKIPPFFSELIRTSRIIDANGKAEFIWATIDAGMELKNRNLPISSKLPADFIPIVKAHRRRMELAKTTTPVVSLVNASKPPEPPKVQIAPMTTTTTRQ